MKKILLILSVVLLSSCGQNFKINCKELVDHVQAKVDKINYVNKTKADVIAELGNPDKNSTENEYYYDIYGCKTFKIEFSGDFVIPQ